MGGGRGPDGDWLPVAAFANEVPGEIRSHGFNTDADAIVRSIQEDLGVKLAGATILLLGAGGAGRVAALKLASEGVATLYLVNRTMKKAEGVATEIARRFPQVRTIMGYPTGSVDLLINATSLGLNPDDPPPIDLKQYDPGLAGAVYDMIYRPAETPLLKSARQAGCRTANGLGMLLYQGARALEVWTGRPAPVEAMRNALKKNIYGT